MTLPPQIWPDNIPPLSIAEQILATLEAAKPATKDEAHRIADEEIAKWPKHNPREIRAHLERLIIIRNRRRGR